VDFVVMHFVSEVNCADAGPASVLERNCLILLLYCFQRSIKKRLKSWQLWQSPVP